MYVPKSPKSRQKVYIEAKYGTRKDLLINSSFLFDIAISVGLDVFEIKIFSLICDGTDKILMCDVCRLCTADWSKYSTVKG